MLNEIQLQQRLDSIDATVNGIASLIRTSTPGRRTEAHKQALRYFVVKFCTKFGLPAEAVVRDRYPTQWKQWKAVERAVVDPARTETPTWAAELSPLGALDLLLGSPSPSLLARLIAAGRAVSTAGVQQVQCPYRPAGATVGAFVGEGEPIPVDKLSLAAGYLKPYKAASLSTFSHELRKAGTPSIESTLDAVLRSDINTVIDAALVDDQPASATRPAGLLYNAVPVTAADPADMVADLQALAGAVLDGSGSGAVLTFICNPVQAIALALASAAGALPYAVLDSGNVPPGTVICLDISSFVGAIEAPEVVVDDEATLHMESETPLPIGTPGSPNVIAAPTRSLWQTATIGMRLITEAGWFLPPARAAFASVSW